jgi:hypothetical protein
MEREKNESEPDKLTEEIISRSLDLNDWLEHIQVEQRKPAIAAVSGNTRQPRRPNAWIGFLIRFARQALGWFRRAKLIEILQVEQFGYAASQVFWGGWCDSPKSNSTYQGNTLLIQGWVIGKPASAVSLRIVVNRTCLREIPIHLVRPDVVEVFKFLPAGAFGFATVLELRELPSRGQLRLDAVFANRQVETLALIEFYRY